MALPEPQLGLVVCYSYLWYDEHRRGQEEGLKDRPCIVVMVRGSSGGSTLVRVVPVTHRAPDRPAAALELPRAVKLHLRLDDDRSWIVVDEVNEFTWPGFDLRPLPGSRDTYAYGFIPPRLFDQLMAKLADYWSEGRGRATTR